MTTDNGPASEDQARGMLGECDGRVYAVEIRKQISELQNW